MSIEKSITFLCGSQRYTIDRYAASSSVKLRPVVIIVHGVDGLGGTSGTQIAGFAEQIAAEGYIVCVPHYFDVADGSDMLSIEELLVRRVPKVATYAMRIAAAVDCALTAPDVDDKRLGLIGFSLGGGLALDYAESAPASKVKAVVDFFGYLSSPTICLHASRLPPTLVLHHKEDKVVPLAVSSKLLLDALGKTKVPHDHWFYTDINPTGRYHPFAAGGATDIDSRTRSVAWMKAHVSLAVLSQ